MKIFLLSFYCDLNKFNNQNLQKESRKEKKTTEYKALSDARKGKLGNKHDPINLFLETYNYDVSLENGEAIKGDKEVKEGKGFKIVTPNNPNKLLTRLPIKAGNNSYKFKKEIRQTLYLLYQHNRITKKVYNNLIKSL